MGEPTVGEHDLRCSFNIVTARVFLFITVKVILRGVWFTFHASSMDVFSPGFPVWTSLLPLLNHCYEILWFSDKE